MRQLLLSALLCLLFACKSSDSLHDPDVIVTTDPEFSVDLYEQRDSADGQATFGLWIQSLETYNCASPQIKAEASLNGQEINIRILGVDDQNCSSGTAYAKLFLPIGKLSPGIYAFTLKLGPTDAISNAGTLLVENGKYTLSLPGAQGIDLQESVLLSLPDPMIWGVVETPDAPAQAKAAQFISQIKNASVEPGLNPGFYGYFTLSATGQWHVHKSISSGAAEEFFVRKTPNGLDDIRTILDHFRTAQDNPLFIRCLSSEGAL